MNMIVTDNSSPPTTQVDQKQPERSPQKIVDGSSQLRSRSLRRRWVIGLLLVLIISCLGLAGLRLVASRSARQHLQLGIEELDRAHYPAARAHFKAFLEVFPRDGQGHLLAARAARLDRDFTDAQSHLEAYHTMGGEETEEYHLEWLMFRASFGEAETVYPVLWSRAASDRPEAARCVEALAYGLMQHNRMDMARKCLDRWLELEPKHPKAHYYLGRWGLVTRDPDLARKHLIRALELDADYEDARLDLAQLHVSEHDWKRALVHFERLHQTRPRDTAVLVGMAQCLRRKGEPAKANALFEEVLQIDPKNAQAMAELGHIAFLADDLATAEKWLNRSLEIDPTDQAATYHLIQCLYRQDRIADAKKLSLQQGTFQKDTERMMQINLKGLLQHPDDYKLYYEMASLLIKYKHYGEAISYLTRGYELNPLDPGICRLLAEYYEYKGDKKRAQEFREGAREAESKMTGGNP